MKSTSSITSRLRSRFAISGAFVGLSALAAACSAAPDGELALHTAEAQTSYSPLPPQTPAAFGAADLANAYNIPTWMQPSTTIAIVTGIDPNAESDLAVYRSAYGLPVCTSATGCFKTVTSSGATSPLPVNSNPDPDTGESTSIALDMASAACPNCKLLVIALSTGQPSELLTAVVTARDLGASAVIPTLSWSDEWDAIPANDSILGNAGLTVFAAASETVTRTGGSSFVIEDTWPAESPSVVSVGVTNLTLATPGTLVTETAAPDGFSQCTNRPKPGWQTDTACSGRTLNDVSAVGGPVWTFNTYYATSAVQLPASGWMIQGATTTDNHGVPVRGLVAASLVAGIFAQTGNGAAGPSYAYAHPLYFNDQNTGSVSMNGSTCAGYVCNAVNGYDGPTGMGTPDGMDMAQVNRDWLDDGPGSIDVENPFLGDQGTGTIIVEPGQVALPWYGVETNVNWTANQGLQIGFSGLPTGVTIQNLGATGSLSAPGANFQIVAGPTATIGQQSTLTISATANGATHYLQYEIEVQACVPTATLASCGAANCGEAIANGCGGQIQCPVIPTTCSALGAACGSVVSCGQTMNCGTCGAGDSCTNNTCCPTGEVGGEGMCCPANEVVSAGHCCPTGEMWNGARCAYPVHLPPLPPPKCGGSLPC